MTEQEIRKLIPELVWERVDGQPAGYGLEDYQALDYCLGTEKMYYRIVDLAQAQDGLYYVSKLSRRDEFKGCRFWHIAKAYSLEDAKQLAQEHRAKAICQMLRATPSSDQLVEDAKPINMRELLWQELDHLSDEANRGEWDTLSSEMKYLKRKQYDTLLSYLTLLDQLAECEAKNAGI